MVRSERAVSVLHFSYSKTGGAGKIASLLATEMKVLGLDSEIITDAEAGIRGEVFTHPARAFWALFDYYIVRRHRNAPLFSLFRDGTSRGLSKLKTNSNRIIHLHWTPGLLSLERIRAFSDNGMPIVWTLHDMWSLTGGCHHSLECNKFKSDCIKCPQTRMLFQRSVAVQFVKKKYIYENCRNLTFVAPSKWMAELAAKSKLTRGHEIHVIPNPVDTTVFKRRPSLVAKNIHRNQDEFVIGVIAADLSDPIKNIIVAKEIFRRLSASTIKPVRLITVGRNPPNYLMEDGITNLGSIAQTESIVDYYNSLDVILCTSLVENFPTVLLEAGACGVSAVAFNVGGIPDIIVDGINGFVVETQENAVLKLEMLLNDSELHRTLSRQARRHVEDNYGLDVVLRKYMGLYTDLINSDWSSKEDK